MSKTYKNGPIQLQERSCTDCLCLIIFIALSATMLVIAIRAWSTGEFKQLTTAHDSDGKGCGTDYPNYPYIYFVSPHIDSLTRTVCVSKCPQQGQKMLQCMPNSKVTTCSQTIQSDNNKAVQIYPTTQFGNKVCLPSSDELKNSVSIALNGQTKKIVVIMQNYELILISLPIAIVLALIVMVFVRCTAGCFIYLLIAATLAGLIGFGVFLLIQPAESTNLEGSLSILQNQTVKISLAVLCLVIAGLLTLFLCCFGKRVALASSIIKVAAIFVANNCLIILIPILLFIVMIAFIALWIVEALGYYSLGQPVTNNGTSFYPFQSFNIPNEVMLIGGLHIFYLFWSILMLIQSGQFLVGGTVVSWYYKRDSPFYQTSNRFFLKHMGSVCMGSFFMALVGFLKFMYEMLSPDQNNNNNDCIAVYKKFCNCCCCLCVSYLFQWFNSGAYSVVNLTGDPYCTSAIKAFTIRLNNLATTSVITVLQIIFTVLIRLGITSLTVLAIYLIITNQQKYKDVAQDSTFLLVLVGLAAFAISCFFISIYSEAMEAIYTTYLLDVQAGGGDDHGLCPDELKDFIKDARKEQHII